MDIFKDEFVANIQTANKTSYTQWKQSNPKEAAKWEAYRDAAIAHKKGQPTPVAPVLSTKYGKALVAAGKLHVSVTDIGSVPPVVTPPPPTPGTWEEAVATALPRPAFTPTRTVTVTSQPQLDSAVAGLLAGDKVNCTGTWTYTGELTIQKQLANFAEIHFNSISFVSPGTHTKIPPIWLNNAQKIRCYGGTVTSSAGAGLRIENGQDVTVQDIVLNNCENTGIHILPISGHQYRIRVKAELHNCGYYYLNDGHPEPGTGWHGCYTGGGSFNLYDSEIALDIYDQQAGAGIELNQTNNSEFWIRANRLLFAAQQQTAGNVVQTWGASQANNTFHWVEGHDITGHAFLATTTMNNCVVEYGLATNYSTNPNSADFAWGTTGGMIYEDVTPQDFGAGD